MTNPIYQIIVSVAKIDPNTGMFSEESVCGSLPVEYNDKNEACIAAEDMVSSFEVLLRDNEQKTLT